MLMQDIAGTESLLSTLASTQYADQQIDVKICRIQSRVGAGKEAAYDTIKPIKPLSIVEL